MDSRAPMLEVAAPEALEFVRFCRARRRVGWPELYDEMWAVASHGLFRGYGFEELQELGIGFSLYGTRDLAALAASVIADEPASSRCLGSRGRMPGAGAAPS